MRAVLLYNSRRYAGKDATVWLSASGYSITIQRDNHDQNGEMIMPDRRELGLNLGPGQPNANHTNG
jgi:hypothetical protein